jgi:glycosyl hydrolase family 43
VARVGFGRVVACASFVLVAASCHDPVTQQPGKTPISQPLVSNVYTADPSAHVFGGRVYVFVSHDIDTGAAENPAGDQFDMRDYRVLSMDAVGGTVTDHGAAIALGDIPWATRQLWAPDTAFRDGTYYLYFPAKDKEEIFRIGVATGAAPTGPYTAQSAPIEGSFSVDPAVFQDGDGAFYMYFGGLMGGQLQRWQSGRYDPSADEPVGELPALGPRVARLSADMLRFDEAVREVQIVDPDGRPLMAKDRERRFFEAAWMHKFDGTYYLSYSTGDTHLICYATGDNPYGPFTYGGVILRPVVGWTSHHSIVEIGGKWYLFYHDSVLSGGKTHLRNVRVTELHHNADGSIRTINAYR